MKRFVSVFLLLSYLLSSPGLVYSMHFCGQVLTAVSVAQRGDMPCCCQPTGKLVAGCCHDQKVTSTLRDVKLTAAQFRLQVPATVPTPAVLRVVWWLATTYPPAEPTACHLLQAAPPPDCPAYVRGHAFLI